jgi:hypothetical protein
MGGKGRCPSQAKKFQLETKSHLQLKSYFFGFIDSAKYHQAE